MPQTLFLSVPPDFPVTVQPDTWLSDALVVLSVVLAMALLKRFLQLLPYLADSFLRMRGSAVLESSVRVSQDRDLVAMALVVPAIVVTYHYNLYNPRFLQGLDPTLRLCAVAAALVAYGFLRWLIYVWVRPGNHLDIFRQAHKGVRTYFIFFMLLVLTSLGVLALAGVESAIIRYVIYAQAALVFLLTLQRCAQLLSLSCNRLRTFLYLCALEILPAALLVVSAVVL